MNMQLLAPKETIVIAACKDASEHGQRATIKALIAGQLLNEYRAALPPSSHSEKTGKFVPKKSDDRFDLFLEKQGIALATAYRWMQAAERVSRAQLGISMDESFSCVIEIEGGPTVPLSHALTAPEKSLPPEALKYRQGVLDFMADHSLGEAARAVFDGESDAKRITLAAGGKAKGGKGSGDRKAFDAFAKTKLKHLTTFLGHKLTVNQKGQIVTAFDAALEQWPRWIIEALAEKCRTELKLNEPDRAARSTFGKA